MSTDNVDFKDHIPHHVSDVDTWGGPDRNYYIFVALSFLGGFMGLDHFYLRSFGTGTQKFLMNLCSFGFWYFWDCAQILQEGQKIRKEGLSSPFDWIRGIGRGVFLEGSNATATAAAAGGGNATATAATAEKSYVTYTILAVFLGFLGANQFYLGNWGQGFAKMFSCFNIFLFLFGWLWVAWDAFHAFFMTSSVLQEGVTPPMPYSLVFEPTDSSVFRVGGGSSTSATEGNIKWLDWLPLPPVPDFSFLSQMVKTLLPLAVTPPVVKAIKELKTPSLSSTMPYSPLSGLPAPSSLLPNAPLPDLLPPMRGGGGGGGAVESSSGAGPIVAGVLTAVVLAGGLKGTYDFITKQYG